MEQYRIRLLLNTLAHATVCYDFIAFVRVISDLHVPKVCDGFQCTMSFNGIYHRQSLYSLGKCLPAFQDTAVSWFSSACLVSPPQYPCLSLPSLTSPRWGATGLTSLLSSLVMLNPLAYYYFLLLVLSTIYDSQIYISHSTLLQIPDSYNQQQLYISTSVSNGHCKCNVPRTESKYFPVSLSTSSIRFVAQLTPLFLLNRLNEDVKEKEEDC